MLVPAPAPSDLLGESPLAWAHALPRTQVLLFVHLFFFPLFSFSPI